jgi:hypothetical protein
MSSISSGTTTTTGYVVSSDTTGALVLKTGASGLTALTIGSDQSVTFVGSQTLSGGTANGVLYLNGSKVATSGSALVFDGSNLGVGTSSPASDARLTLASPNTESYVMFSRTNSGVFDVAIGNSGGSIVFRGGADSATVAGLTEFMRLDSVGNLGLGVTPSAWKSSYRVNQIGLAGSLAARTDLSSVNISSNWYENSAGSDIYINTGFATRYHQFSGAHSWFTAASGTAGNAITFTQAMTLDASGNLGVGTTSPSARLHTEVTNSTNAGVAVAIFRQNGSGNNGIVVDAASTPSNYVADFRIANSSVARIDSSGNLLVGTTSSNTGIDTGNTKLFVVAPNSSFGAAITAVADSSGRTIRLTDQARSIQAAIDASSSGLSIGTNSVHDLRFLTSGTEKARIDTSGNLLVGTTSSSSKLQITTSANQNAIDIRASSASYTQTGVQVLIDRNTTNNSFYAFTYYNVGRGDYSFVVADSGNVRNTNNSYGALSDVKLKENISDATPKLEKLNQVRVVNYNLIGETQKQIGVIAQELEKIFPSMIEEFPDRDAEGNNLGTTTKGVKYSVFVPMLIKAIQEQQAIIESLTTRITALEGTS